MFPDIFLLQNRLPFDSNLAWRKAKTRPKVVDTCFSRRRLVTLVKDVPITYSVPVKLTSADNFTSYPPTLIRTSSSNLDLSNCKPLSTTFSIPIQFLTAILLRTSLKIVLRHPTTRLAISRFPQRLSLLRLIWSAHCHISWLIRWAISMTLLLCWIFSSRILIASQFIVGP